MISKTAGIPISIEAVRNTEGPTTETIGLTETVAADMEIGLATVKLKATDQHLLKTILMAKASLQQQKQQRLLSCEQR